MQVWIELHRLDHCGLRRLSSDYRFG
jgi:hypothetical protein